MKCTWKDCTSPAGHKQIRKDGSVWADLCDIHSKRLDASILGPVPEMLKCWVLANGGAKILAEKM